MVGALQGRVACCGSPMFLKHNYGVGYQMTMVKASVRTFTGLVSLLFGLACVLMRTVLSHVASYSRFQSGTKIDEVNSTVMAIPGAEVLSNVGTELSFRLPMHESAKFPAMLAQVRFQEHFESFTS